MIRERRGEGSKRTTDLQIDYPNFVLQAKL